jgi:acyl-CoA reductase-like NAD-dependent aldehyde dehydrogenase
MASNGVKKLDFTTFHNSIDGKLTSTKETRHNINPATKKANAEVPVCTPEDVDTAVAAARKAFTSWSKVPYEQRQKAVRDYADALASYREEFSNLLVSEQGKPLHLAQGEVDSGSAWLNGLAKYKVEDEHVEEDSDREIIVRYTPLGVCVGIVPWNFPVQLCLGKIAPAVLTGCTIIIKPSPFTPYCDLKLGELAQQFFPPGVVQVISGDDNLGPWLTAHPGVDKISFTGSTFTGKKVMESASKTLKRVTLELGGNDPAIVCADVDIETTAAKIATLSFLNSGQICLALKRIYVHESIYDKFLEAAVAFTKTLKQGEGHEEGVFLGPIQNKMQFDRVSTFFDDIEKSGQKVAVGGSVDGSKGYFVQPTIIDQPKDDSKLVVEEPFGMLSPICSYATLPTELPS